jgi:glycosyltransferase involved in cell wall biosynthesis
MYKDIEVYCNTKHHNTYADAKVHTGVLSLLKALIFKGDHTFFCFDHYAILPIIFFRKVTFYSHLNYGKDELLFGFKDFFLKFLYMIIVKYSSRIIATSEYSNEFIKKIRPELNVEILYPLYNYNMEKIVKISKLKATKESKYIIVGYIEKRKYQYLIDNINIIGIKLDIYGGIGDKDLEIQLRSSKHINIFGYVNDIPYAEYDFMLQITSMDNVPAIIPEAINAGVAVISRDIGGCSELITNNTGITLSDYEMKRLLMGDSKYEIDFNNTAYEHFFCSQRLNQAQKLIFNSNV